MGYIGVSVALVLFMYFVYKGWKNYYVAPICMIIVCAFNGLNPVDAFSKTYIPGLLTMAGNVFVILFLGTIFGRVYADTGASIAIVKALSNRFVNSAQGNKKVLCAILVFYISSSLCVIGGIDSFALFFTLFPIAVVLCEKANIPRRFIPAMLYLDVAFAGAPGVPQIFNVITITAFKSVGYDFDIRSAMVPGFIAALVISGVSIWILYTMIKKANLNGECFEYGDVEKYNIDDDRPLPNVLVAILPLVLVFVLYTVCRFEILVALTSGILLDIVLMGKYLDRSESGGSFAESLKLCLNRGVASFPDAILGVCVPNALAMVITTTAAFGTLVAFLGGLTINPIVLVIITVCIVVAITSSPPTAILIGIPLVVGILKTQGLPVNVAGLGRVAVLAALTFEVLPYSGAIVLTLGISKVTHKQGFKALFVMSVVSVSIGMLVCAALVVLFPGLS